MFIALALRGSNSKAKRLSIRDCPRLVHGCSHASVTRLFLVLLYRTSIWARHVLKGELRMEHVQYVLALLAVRRR
jgi:hypothetical protein